jgi:hypothetical protein
MTTYKWLMPIALALACFPPVTRAQTIVSTLCTINGRNLDPGQECYTNTGGLFIWLDLRFTGYCTNGQTPRDQAEVFAYCSSPTEADASGFSGSNFISTQWTMVGGGVDAFGQGAWNCNLNGYDDPAFSEEC